MNYLRIQPENMYSHTQAVQKRNAIHLFWGQGVSILPTVVDRGGIVRKRARFVYRFFPPPPPPPPRALPETGKAHSFVYFIYYLSELRFNFVPIIKRHRWSNSDIPGVLYRSLLIRAEKEYTVSCHSCYFAIAVCCYGCTVGSAGVPRSRR